MNNKTIIAIVIVVILIALGILWLAPFDNPAREGENVNTEEGTAPESVKANHFFKDGTHNLEGTIIMPTPCHSLVTNVIVNEVKDAAVVNFVGTAGTGVCVQVVADKFFTANFQANEDAAITATYNGKTIRLDLVEGEEGGIEKL